jgi:hypothetical protein
MLIGWRIAVNGGLISSVHGLSSKSMTGRSPGMSTEAWAIRRSAFCTCAVLATISAAGLPRSASRLPAASPPGVGTRSEGEGVLSADNTGVALAPASEDRGCSASVVLSADKCRSGPVGGSVQGLSGGFGWAVDGVEQVCPGVLPSPGVRWVQGDAAGGGPWAGQPPDMSEQPPSASRTVPVM